MHTRNSTYLKKKSDYNDVELLKSPSTTCVHYEFSKIWYSKPCLNWTLNKPKSCINRTLNKVLMQEIFVNLICIYRTPVYSEHKSWSQKGSVQTGSTVLKYDSILWLEDSNLYLPLRTMSHTIYAAKFEQTIIHQHVHLWQESQSHAPAHVLMRIYPIDKSLICLQSERRKSCYNYFYMLIPYSFIYTILHRKVNDPCFILSLDNLSKWIYPWLSLQNNKDAIETRVPGKKHRPVISHWQFYHLMLYWIHFAMSRIRTHNLSGDRHWFYR